MIDVGQQEGYYWLVSESEIRALPELAERFHVGLQLWFTAFDSSPFRPAPEEIEQGWREHAGYALSPVIDDTFRIPTYDRFNEWYFFERPPIIDNDIQIFVNYGVFTLALPTDHFNPAWRNAEYLIAAQEGFWNQLRQLKPQSYVAMGDYDIVVSRNVDFIDAVRRAAFFPGE